MAKIPANGTGLCIPHWLDGKGPVLYGIADFYHLAGAVVLHVGNVPCSHAINTAPIRSCDTQCHEIRFENLHFATRRSSFFFCNLKRP